MKNISRNRPISGFLLSQEWQTARCGTGNAEAQKFGDMNDGYKL